MHELMIAKFIVTVAAVLFVGLVYLPRRNRQQAEARSDVRAWLQQQGHADAEVSFGDTESRFWRFRVSAETLPESYAIMQKRGRAISLTPAS